MTKRTPEQKTEASQTKPVLVHLSQADYTRLVEICKARHQTRADFFRDAIEAHGTIPQLHAVKLRGICLERHKNKVKAEKRAARRTGKH